MFSPQPEKCGKTMLQCNTRFTSNVAPVYSLGCYTDATCYKVIHTNLIRPKIGGTPYLSDNPRQRIYPLYYIRDFHLHSPQNSSSASNGFWVGVGGGGSMLSSVRALSFHILNVLVPIRTMRCPPPTARTRAQTLAGLGLRR